MDRLPFPIDPYANDSGTLGVSLVNLAELIVPCLDAAGVRSVAEIGAYAGDLTGLLLDWAERADASVLAVDPQPQPELEALERDRPRLELRRQTSLEALQEIDLPDAVVIDGDHNWWTVSEELRIIGERAPGEALPLVLFHDVSWPHGRRDDYFAPELVPDEFRQPTVNFGSVKPGVPGLADGGVPYRWPAAHEGGPRNGVLTAAEDFAAARGGLRLAVIPAFFGLGVLWREDAPWADDLEALLGPWDRDPLLERLELNRVHHLASGHGQIVQASIAAEAEKEKDAVLENLLRSKSFLVAEVLSRVKGRGRPAFTREQVRRALRG